MILFQFEGKDLYFGNPIQVIETYHINEVKQKLAEVEQAVAMGYYAAGFLTYEASAAFHSLTNIHKSSMPLLWFAIFSEPSAKNLPDTEQSFSISNWSPTISYHEYQEKIAMIHQEIKQGNTYQINYTQRLRASFSGEPFALYQKLVKAQKGNYSAFINTGKHHILSISPELFFKQDGSLLTTKPMKGTCLRGRNQAEDEAQRQWLFDSEKNRAENLMIVDLLRNDIGKIAEIGQVAVPKLFEIEEYPTVFQMTSTITAQLKRNISYAELFESLFPSGSVTGAPKLNSMKLIATLESEAREVYCGAIGYFTPDNKAVFNVPIRTCWIDSETKVAEYSIGGGITWDSDAQEEFQECFAKAKILTKAHTDFELLESLRLENGQFPLLHFHLERLAKSARFFKIAIDFIKLKQKLTGLADFYPHGLHKVRILIDHSGKTTLECLAIKETVETKSVYLAQMPIISQNDFLYHKTTNRDLFRPFQKEGFFDCLLWNEKEEITEFTTGNVVLQMSGELLTPPLSCGLLPGVMRESLLRKKIIKEQTVTLNQLKQVDKIWYVNSVRGWVEVQLRRHLND